LPQLQTAYTPRVEKPQAAVPVQDLEDQYGVKLRRPQRRKDPSPERNAEIRSPRASPRSAHSPQGPKAAHDVALVAATAPPGSSALAQKTDANSKHASTARADFAAGQLALLPPPMPAARRSWNSSTTAEPFGASEASDMYWAATNERPFIVRLDLSGWHVRGHEFQEEITQLRKDVFGETSELCRKQAREWKAKQIEELKRYGAYPEAPRYIQSRRYQPVQPKLLKQPSTGKIIVGNDRGGVVSSITSRSGWKHHRQRSKFVLPIEQDSDTEDAELQEKGMLLISELRKRREKQRQKQLQKQGVAMTLEQSKQEQRDRRLEEARDRKERLVIRQREQIRRTQLQEAAGRRASRRSVAPRASVLGAAMGHRASKRGSVRASIADQKSMLPSAEMIAAAQATAGSDSAKSESEDQSRDLRRKPTVQIGHANVIDEVKRDKCSRLRRFETHAHLKRKQSKAITQDSDESQDEEPPLPTLSRRSSFDQCLMMANMYKVPISEVRRAFGDYQEMDTDGDGTLSFQEFEAVIRKMCDIPAGDAVPEHLMLKQWKDIDRDGSNAVDFMEYFQWTLRSGWKEDLMVHDAHDRAMRQLARDLGVAIVEVEKLKRMFDAYDVDGSGFIDHEEFKAVLCEAMGVKDPSEVSQHQLQRYWKEADASNMGELGLKEFMVWYINVYPNSWFGAN